MEKIYVIGLARVSTQKQWNTGDSPENQAEAIRKHAESKGEIVLDVFKEHFTGTKIDRPAIKKALEFIDNSKHKISKCYFYNIDRSSRGGHDVHHGIKKLFQDRGVRYLDIFGVVQEKRKVVDIEGVNTDEYEWAYENPNEYAEEMMVMSSESEKKRILQRTISQEIRNTKGGYHQRESHFGLKNHKVYTPEGKTKVIEVDHDTESLWMKKIYELRKIGVPDDQIVQELNSIGFKRRPFRRLGKMVGEGPLDSKYLQRLIKNPVYAGIKIEKWTGNKPVKIPYTDGYTSLVDTDTWNKANKGKIRILEKGDGTVEIVYSEKGQEQFEPIVAKRSSYNKDYPYARVLRCPICSGYLTPNKSRSRNGVEHHYYQCNGKKNEHCNGKHENYSCRRDEVNEKLIEFIGQVKPGNGVVKALEYMSSIYFDQKTEQNKDVAMNYENKLKGLKNQKQEIEENIPKYLSLPNTIQALEGQLIKINTDLTQVEREYENNIRKQRIDKHEFGKFVLYGITHMQELAIDSGNPDKINLIFSFIFPEKPTYEEILSHTPKVYPIFALQSQQKNSPEGEFLNNTLWQPH